MDFFSGTSPVAFDLSLLEVFFLVSIFILFLVFVRWASVAMPKTWRIHKLLHGNTSPNERDMSPTEEICPPFSSEEPQSEQQLRWESFENNLAQRMGKSTVKKDIADQERGSKKIVSKSLAPKEKPVWSRALMDDLGQKPDPSRRNKVVGKSVLMSTADEKADIPRASTTSSSVPVEESGPTKIYTERNPAKATMKNKPSESDFVSLKSRATTSTTSSESTLSTCDSPSVATDSIAYTGSYTRATLESLVDDELSLITFDQGSYTPCRWDDESSIGTLPTPLIAIERLVMRLSSLFLCDAVQDEPTPCRSSGRRSSRQGRGRKRDR